MLDITAIETVSSSSPEHSTALTPAARNVERGKTKENLEQRLSIALYYLDTARDALDDQIIERAGNYYLTNQTEIDLKAAQVLTKGGLFTTAEALNLEEKTLTFAYSEARKLIETIEKSYRFMLSEGQFEAVLKFREDIEKLFPKLEQSVRIEIIQEAFKKGRLDIAEQMLEGASDVSLYKSIDIAKEQLKHGTIDPKLLEIPIEYYAWDTPVGQYLDNLISTVILYEKTGKDSSEVIKRITNLQKDLSENRIVKHWFYPFKDLPFDLVDERNKDRDVDLFYMRADEYYHPILALLEEGIIGPAEEFLADKKDFDSQCILAAYKGKNGQDSIPNLAIARNIIDSSDTRYNYSRDSYSNLWDRRKATLVSVECKLGLLEDAEETRKKINDRYDMFAPIIADSELSMGFWEQDNEEKGRFYYDKATEEFLSAQDLSETERQRISLKLSAMGHARRIDTTNIIRGGITPPSIYMDKNILFLKRAQEYGLDARMLLAETEKAIKAKYQNDESFYYYQLIELTEMYQDLGEDIIPLLDEQEELYKTLGTYKHSQMGKLLASNLKIPEDRRNKYWEQYFQTLDQENWEWSFVNNKMVQSALSEGKYKLVWSALQIKDDEGIRHQTFDSAIKAGDFKFAEMIADKSKDIILRAKYVAHRSIREDDFSIIDKWLEENAKIVPEDLGMKTKKSEKRERNPLSQFASVLSGALGAMDMVDKLEMAAKIRLAASEVLLKELKPEIEALKKEELNQLLAKARQAKADAHMSREIKHELEFFGLDPGASWSEVRRSYNTIIKRMHPDLKKTYDAQFEAEKRGDGMDIEAINKYFEKIRELYVRTGLFPTS